ncbi:MAG: hypothetical protein U9O56_05130 [Campylobacterota bacterium]|nr:hypothetical protein [Campylobacterota bacterium]
MRELILISKTPIVIKIFTLIAKKLGLKLEVLDEAQIDHKVDLIIVDKEFIDDRFNILKTYSKQIGAITNEQLPFELANDFTIPLPFLPSNLQSILEKQIETIKNNSNKKRYITSIEPDTIDIPQDEPIVFEEEADEELNPALQYLDNLASGIATDIEETQSDESLVSLDPYTQSGGVLDTSELSKLEKMIGSKNEEHISFSSYESTNQIDENQYNQEQDKWSDLSSIIDDAICEVNSKDELYSYNEQYKDPIVLTINNYSLNELAPLFNLLNQDIIDNLTNGQTINLQLQLGDNYE